MDKPRRRAAGRPAGPPNVVAAPSPADPAPAVSSPASSTSTPVESAANTSTAAEPTGQQHRRRQRPARQAGGEEAPSTGSVRDTSTPDPEPVRSQHQRQSSGQSSGRDERRRGESPVERSLRALVSTRTTQLPPSVAMRAREVAAPTRADLAAAEEELVIVRRYYVPPAPLATTGKVNDQRMPEKRPSDTRGRAAESRRGGRRSQ